MRRTALGLVGVTLMTALLGALAQAAEAQAVWGYVDMEKLAAGYKAMQDLNQQFQTFAAQQDAQFEQRQKARMLSDEEQREFLDLATAAAPTETRDKRLQELEDLSNQRERRLLDLRENKPRTPEEEKEYQYLSGISEKKMAELVAMKQDQEKVVRAEYERLSKIVTDGLDAAVKAVAEQQKLAIVVRKDMVLWGGVDITDAVLAKLNALPAR